MTGDIACLIRATRIFQYNRDHWSRNGSEQSVRPAEWHVLFCLRETGYQSPFTKSSCVETITQWCNEIGVPYPIISKGSVIFRDKTAAHLCYIRFA